MSQPKEHCAISAFRPIVTLHFFWLILPSATELQLFLLAPLYLVEHLCSEIAQRSARLNTMRSHPFRQSGSKGSYQSISL